MARLSGIAFFSLLGSLVLPITVTGQQPTVLYVNRTDPTCGGQSPCFTTIQSAVNAAGPGDDIHIQVGSYPEQLTITGKNNFSGVTETDRIIIEADPTTQPGQVVLTGAPGACTGNYAIRLQQSKFITIRGLTITGTGGQAVSLLGGNNQNQDIHIELNRIFANGSSSCDGGITVNRGNPGTLIVNNLIYANGRNGISFIDSDGGPHYVINNTIYGNQWNGVDVARNHTITFANNIINHNGTASGTTGGRYGVRRESSTTPQPAGIKLLNNLVCGNTQGEISTQILDATDSSNFTPLGNEGAGVGALPGCEVPANLFGNVNGADNQPNTADDDFSLKPNSLAIDIGIDPRTLGFNPSYNPIFEADFVVEGIRPADGNADRTPAFDAGAFEFPNSPPLANAGANQSVSVNQLTNLNGSQSSDPEGAPLTFQWSIISQPAGSSIALNGANTATPSFTPLIAGQYIFELVVNDGQFASAPSTVVVTASGVNPLNHPPVLSSVGNKTVAVNNTLTFTVSATDPDNDPLTYSISPLPLPANASFDVTTRAFSFTPTASQAGSFSLTFAVSDGRGGTASETITITVTNGLSINITSPANGATVAAGQLIVLGTVTNPSSGEVGVTVNGFPAGAQGNTFTASVIVTADTSTITATATSSGATATQTVNIAVLGSAASAGDLFASPTGGVAPLTVKFSLRANADVTQITLDADGDGIVDFTGASLDQQSFTYTQPGIYLATATATDAAGVQRSSNAVIQVFDRAQLDALLQARWSSLRDALIARDIPRALDQLIAAERERYGALFTQLGDLLTNLGTDMPTLQAIYLDAGHAKYRLRREQNVGGVPTQITYYVYFSIDSDGIWRIDSF